MTACELGKKTYSTAKSIGSTYNVPGTSAKVNKHLVSVLTDLIIQQTCIFFRDIMPDYKTAKQWMWPKTCIEAINRFRPGYHLVCSSHPQEILLSHGTKVKSSEGTDRSTGLKHMVFSRSSFLEGLGTGKRERSVSALPSAKVASGPKPDTHHQKENHRWAGLGHSS